jgi:hypothetical protein
MVTGGGDVAFPADVPLVVEVGGVGCGAEAVPSARGACALPGVGAELPHPAKPAAAHTPTINALRT